MRELGQFPELSQNSPSDSDFPNTKILKKFLRGETPVSIAITSSQKFSPPKQRDPSSHPWMGEASSTQRSAGRAYFDVKSCSRRLFFITGICATTDEKNHKREFSCHHGSAFGLGYELRYSICLVGLRTKNNPGKSIFGNRNFYF